MKKNQMQRELAVLDEFKNNISHVSAFNGFKAYQEWRNGIFDFFGNIIRANNIEKAQAMLNLSLIINDDLDIFFEADFFHEGYKDNLKLSAEIFFNNFDSPEKAQELIKIIDLYVKPTSKNTQDFRNSFFKGMSGLFAYLLTQQEGCSENLALWISKQAFGHGSEKTVYDALKKIKIYVKAGKSIPLSAKLALFYILFSEKEVDWKTIKPRMKHTLSKNDLAKGMEALNHMRQAFIASELKSAQKSLKNHPERFDGIITPEFTDLILNFNNQDQKIDDEITLAVLWASFFGSAVFSSMIPSQ